LSTEVELSEERSEMLLQQEGEMRQNTEELQATQEEMIRQRKELEQEIQRLKKLTKDLA